MSKVAQQYPEQMKAYAVARAAEKLPAVHYVVRQPAHVRRMLNEAALAARLAEIDTRPEADYYRVCRYVERLRELRVHRPTISEMYFDTLRRPGFTERGKYPPPRFVRW